MSMARDFVTEPSPSAEPKVSAASAASVSRAAPLRVLDLFSGIGGFSLGLERTGGFKTVAFCEIEPFCRRVLAKHWPKVPAYDDVRTLTGDRLRSDGIAVDVICGGFPCQDISVAGKGAGLAGERSGLWAEYARLVRELRPRLVIVENVAALLGRGLDRVLGDLAALRFDAEWHCIPASAIGAPHERDRLWVVAHANHGQRLGSQRPIRARRDAFGGSSEVVAYADRLPGAQQQRDELRFCRPAHVAASYDRNRSAPDGNWSTEPGVGRVAHGVPNRVDRLRSLGNAVVPQIPELIGNAILALLPQGIEARSDETRSGSTVGESPVGEADAPSNLPLPTTPSSTGA